MTPTAAGRHWFDELIGPRTDGGISAQALVVLVVAALLFRPVYRARVVTLLLGTLMFGLFGLFGLFGMRAFH